MSRLAVALSAVFLVLLGSCASTEFKVYEGRGSVVEGRGGTRAIVNGMDLWENGEPPRKFKLLGLIEDERPGGIISMGQLHADIVKKAREVGGQALIKLHSRSQLMGYQTSGYANTTTLGSTARATGSATTIAARRNFATFAVILYLE
jgi:hypothetical protein